ncbi:major facilitator transporter (plasmid) [Ketogulonicigenium robustum]|uniref:Major facilitator transporter n=1 Tax=Ketogulonicigenium robustum TaxID=92947 RepID=A0A1W6P372_9RHOB|nr:MFS transporter [Ketogulonicigenium robustum]ARO15841.1 major facilitator transporter [Ketogulonicigenium robustum]
MATVINEGAPPPMPPTPMTPSGRPALLGAGMTPVKALPYFLAALLTGLATGLGQGFVMTNLPQIAGDLGVDTTDASWLLAAYMIPRSVLPLILTKVRSQIGLRRFTEFSIVAFVAVAFASLWITDFRSALIVQFLSGSAAAPLMTLTFLYMLEPLSPPAKIKIGLPVIMTVILIGPSFARVISPSLIGDGGLMGVHTASLGLALLSFAVVWLLPLQAPPPEKVIQAEDFISFALIGFGFSGIVIGAVMGPIYWWTAAGWIGALIAASVGALAAAIIVELRRPTPLIDFRWLATPAMLHLTLTLLLFRLVLSEQSAGAPRMFQVLGVGQGQLVGLFSVICVASIIGGLICVIWIRPTREAAMHAAALVLIALAAYLDSHSTVDTRPHQFLFSQSLIAIASMLFMPPAMMMGMMAALRKGPQYILSFIIVFISTQSLGAVLGSGLFNTFTNHQQVLHLATLTEQLVPSDPLVQASIARQSAALALQNPDMAANRQQSVTQMVTDASQQAWVMAYNDAYKLISLVALVALAALVLHVLRDKLAARLQAVTAPTPTPASAPAPAGAQPVRS